MGIVIESKYLQMPGCQGAPGIKIFGHLGILYVFEILQRDTYVFCKTVEKVFQLHKFRKTQVEQE